MLVLLALSACVGPTAGIGIPGAEPGPADGGDHPPKLVARVRGVMDGDTLVARVEGEPTTLRMIGIDAPELAHPPDPEECFARESSAYAQRRLEGRDVLVEYDVERIDSYDRTLAYVWIGRRLFNEDMVRQGFATVATIPPNIAHVERLVEAEKRARHNDLGVWGACLLPIDTGADWRELGDA